MVVPIFEKVFAGADLLPDPEHAEIIGTFEDGKLQGFVVLEKAVFIWEFWSRDDKNNGTVARKLVRWVREHIPRKQAVGAVANDSRFHMLFRTLGMDEVPGKIFWRKGA